MKVLLQSLSLFPMDLLLSTDNLLEMVKRAGFDGIEIINISWRGLPRIAEISSKCRNHGLICHAHQLWGLKQNPELLVNKLFRATGLIPGDGSDTKKQFGNHGLDIPMVLYSDNWREALDNHLMWLQTCSTHDCGELVMPYHAFKKTVLRYRIPLVFDTTHQLEYRNELLDISRLPRDSAQLLSQISEDWNDLGKLVQEMHLCDFDPALGPEKGRNLPLGSGVFPINEFVRLVKNTCWDGVVVPEVRPNVASNLNKQKCELNLARINSQVRRYFE